MDIQVEVFTIKLITHQDITLRGTLLHTIRILTIITGRACIIRIIHITPIIHTTVIDRCL